MKKEVKLPTLIRDTREKERKGYNFIKSPNCAGSIDEKLETGDYSVLGLEDIITIERKGSVSELFGNFGQDRERFFNEIERMRKIKYKFLMLEFPYESILKGCIWTKVTPNFVISNLLKLEIEEGIHVIYAGDKISAHDLTRRILLKIWKYHQEGRINGNNTI